MSQSADSARPPCFQPDELLRPEAYPHPVTQIQLRETHISWVILTGTFAYKIKKAMQLDFIDTSTLERRRYLCEEELRLNRRLAAELYLDVVPIVEHGGRLCVGGSGAAVEYAVRMRQFDSAAELLSLLRSARVATDEVTALAELIAHFHLQAAVAKQSGADQPAQRVYQAVLGNLLQLTAQLQRDAGKPALRQLIDWTNDSARALETQFNAREVMGYIRECHGDLHAANIVHFQGRLIPFDCLEFNAELRWIDVIDDLAFLLMDFISHRRVDLAFIALNRYLEITGDYPGVQLLRFYAVYRALVRARVDALAAEQAPAKTLDFRERMQRRIDTALGLIRPTSPLLVLMHGVSGSGKSWLSERLITAIPAVRIRSDVERKRLAGAREAGHETSPNIYSIEFGHRTYARLADCAETCLSAGYSTIVDATFLSATDRELFHTLAARLQVPHVIVSCEADRAVLQARVAQREREHRDVSDANLAVLERQVAALQPFEPDEEPFVLRIDTGAADSAQNAIEAIRKRMPRSSTPG